jgi:hypothetical protein
MANSLEQQRKTTVLAAVIAVALWLVPTFRPALLPLLYLNTHIHEFCHAMAALVSGGHPLFIAVRADASGVTPVNGGSMLLVGSAGYLGAAIIGGAMIYFGRSEKGAKRVFSALLTILAFSMLVWVRGDGIGVASGILWVLIFALVVAKGKGRGLVIGSQFLGIQQALTSLQAVLVLFKVSTYGEQQSDAGILQEVSGVPALVWASLWVLVSVAVVGLTIHRSWRDRAS